MAESKSTSGSSFPLIDILGSDFVLHFVLRASVYQMDGHRNKVQ